MYQNECLHFSILNCIFVLFKLFLNKKMTQTYKVTGMSCGHCEAQVKNALLSHENITSAEVSKDTQSASITSEQPIKLERLKSMFDKFEGMFEISSIQ